MIKAPKKPIITPVLPARSPALRIPKAFAELAQDDPKVLNQVFNGFETVIRASFATNPVPSGTVTAAHVKERFAICERWYRALREEKKWGVIRILDNLGEALHAELNGNTWQPDNRKCWMPEDGH